MDPPSHQDSMHTKRQHSTMSLSSSDSSSMSDEEDHAAKRQKTMSDNDSPAPTMQNPNATVDVSDDGDIILVVNGLAGVTQPMGIRVSSGPLSFASPVFHRLLQPNTIAVSTPISVTNSEPRQIHLPSDDADSLFMLCNILHLRNDHLPSKIQPEQLFRFVACCAKYECLVAASRAATQWLDHLYTTILPPSPDIFKLIEACYILNDATYFARFTSRWVLSENGFHDNAISEPPRQRLAATLLARQQRARIELSQDIDILVDPLAEALSDDAKHYIDCAPGDEPTPDEDVPEPPTCVVDKEGSTLYLSALRDANLWPATRMLSLSSRSLTISDYVTKIENFRMPEYNASDACYWCINVDDKFANALSMVAKIHKTRLWGLCLDCYKIGGTASECRYEHDKIGNLSSSLGSAKGPNKG